MSDPVGEALTHLARDHSGRVLARLARHVGDVDLADDAVQEALIEAARRWPADGVPNDPPAWLSTVARRKAIDLVRRDVSRRRRLRDAAPELVGSDDRAGTTRPPLVGTDDGPDPGDERLRLVLLCCHPALGLDAQVALTLRLVAGLTTEEIAAAFVVPTPTVAQRISRAKRKIRTAGIPMSLPARIDERLGPVLSVLYLTFNEGYLSRSGAETPMRIDLCAEALRLTEVVCALAPDQAEAVGLLALLRFVHARRDARFRDGRLVLLDQQDRTRWHLDEIGVANTTLAAAMTMMRPGAFQLQAIIASHHSNARAAEDTDWARIVALYDQLVAMRPSPIVALNRAVAVAMADGPLAGLAALDAVASLDGYHLYWATRGELSARAGDVAAARQALERARSCTTNRSERDHLARRLAQLG